MSIKENIEKIAKAVEDSAAKAAGSVAKISGDVLESSRLRLNLAAAEGNKDDLLKKIGRQVYELHETGTELPVLLDDSLKEVQAADEKIQGIKDKLREIKNIKICTVCSTMMKSDDSYCSRCGAKLPEEAAAETASEEGAAASIEEVYDEYYKKPVSDDDGEICGPLNCDKEL
jgi:high-affinity K+ transport system ATPase subunit B